MLFAGIMGFIYSDLMVPPLVAVNAKYYGWRAALYMAGVMYVSIVATALLLGALFGLLGITPDRLTPDARRDASHPPGARSPHGARSAASRS